MSSAATVTIRFSSLGDVVLAGAVTGGLAPVWFLTLPRFREVAAALPGVERVIAWGEEALPDGVARVVDLHASPRSRLAAFRMGGTVRRVRRYDLRRRLRAAFKVGEPPPRVVDRYAEAAGVPPAPAPWVACDGPRDALLLCPGASSATKRWPSERWIEIGRRWEGPVVVLGGAPESESVSGIAEAIGAEALAEDGFRRTLEALPRGRAAVGGDTGLLHLCAAAGMPVVGLFGPTTSRDGFWCHRGTALEVALDCRPCSLHGDDHCPMGDHLCMEGLSVDRVWQAVRMHR